MGNGPVNSLTQPVVRIAAAGLGAAVAGPLGAALGGWLGCALGTSAAELLGKSLANFGEKAGEKWLEIAANVIAGTSVGPPPCLEDVYRKTLRLSLNDVRRQIPFAGFDDWFENWEYCLAKCEALELACIAPDQLILQDFDDLFRLTMERLDAQGAAMQREDPSLRSNRREMPSSLLAEIQARIPDRLQVNFRDLIGKPENDQAWKQFVVQLLQLIGTLPGSGQYTPSLSVRLIYPTKLPCILPAAKDKLEYQREGMLQEAARWGMSDAGWYSDARALPEQVKCVDAYRKEVFEWMIDVGEEFLREHEHETDVARSLFLVFEISNVGQAPADGATLQIEFSHDLSVDKEPRATYFLLPTLPVPPASLSGLRVNRVSQGYVTRGLYPGDDPPTPPYNPACVYYQLSRQPDEAGNDRRNVFKAFFPRIEHGETKRTTRLRVSFKYQPVHDLVILCRLHASNQPKNSEIKLIVEVREKSSLKERS
jgi:hypothetical protein